jgi:hypothetical protein
MRGSVRRRDSCVALVINAEGTNWKIFSRRMSNNAPYTLAVQIIRIILLMSSKLRVGQEFQSQTRAEESYSDTVGVFRMDVKWRCRGAGIQSSERKREWQRNNSLEESFRQEHGEESLVPESFFLLGFIISRIVSVFFYGSRCNAVEEASSPCSETGEKKLLCIWEV